VAVVIVAILAGRGGDTGVALGNSDEAQIRRVLQRFAVAIDRNDRGGIVAALCAEEAETFTEGVGEAEDPEPDTSSSPPPVEISDVRVTGDVASVRVARPPVPATTMYLRKEDGVWKVCAAAEAQPTPSGSGSGSGSGSPSASASPSR
jgi:hypothetical protein